ncbi:MAG: O-antigen ligase family protein [Patescibacteria group bacterium]|nr:O-antigen ligase family protein [Patescibacteria group bacterium]
MTSISSHNKPQDTRFKIQDTIFGFIWRLTILLLPLQTRWFSNSTLAGWPFEQGRLSFYISWIPLIITIILSFFVPKTNLSKKLRINLFWFVVLLGAINIVSTPVDIRASGMWWIQIFLLTAFFITLLRANISLKSILSWFVISLIPHAILAFVQVSLQYVHGWSWIGVATQDPKNLGVSVVEAGDLRFLRAYGGFPHPNILGGFMTFGILIATWISTNVPFDQLKNKIDARGSTPTQGGGRGIFLITTIPLFAMALFYSFSRSAWIALAVSLSLVLVKLPFDQIKNKIDARWGTPTHGGGRGIISLRSLGVLFFIIATFSFFAYLNWELFSTRVGLAPEPARLEIQSTSARSDSLTDGIKVFQAYPIFGTGPNSELPALSAIERPLVKGGDLTQGVKSGDFRPLEPPHNVFVLILANFGTAGALIIFGFLLFLLRQILIHWRSGDSNLRSLSVALLFSWLIISLFDHYLYTLWSGQLLTIFTAFIIIFWLNKNKADILDA